MPDWLAQIFGGGGNPQMAAAGPIPPVPQGVTPQAVPPDVLQGNPLTGSGSRWDAALAGLGQLGQNLTNQYQRRALGTPAGPQGNVADAIFRAQQLGRQQNQQSAYDEMVSRLPPSQQGIFRALGADRGAQLLGVAATRPTARPATDAEITQGRVTRNGPDGRPLPWMINEHGALTLPEHDPNVAGAVAGAQSDQRIYPWTAGGGLATGASIRGNVPPGAPGMPSGAPGMVPRPTLPTQSQGLPASPAQAPLPGGQPGVDRPYTPADILQTNPGISPAEAQTLAQSANEAYPIMPRAAQPGARPPSVSGGAPAPSQGTAGLTRTAPGVMVDTRPAPGTQQGRYEAQAGENSAQYLNTRIVQPAQASVQALRTAGQMRTILGTGDIQAGPGSAVRDYVAELARSYGGEAGTRWANSIQGADYATLRGLTARQVLDGLGGSLGTGISNADRDYIASTVPNPFQSNESMQRFLSLIEDRALGQIDRSMQAYARSAPNYNAQTDPFVNDMHLGMQDLGINPADLRGERSRRQATEQQRRNPSSPQPPAPTSAPVTIGGQRGVETTIPQQDSAAPRQQPSTQVQTTPMTQRDGRNVINESSLRDGVTYSGGLLGPGQHRWNAQTRTFSRID